MSDLRIDTEATHLEHLEVMLEDNGLSALDKEAIDWALSELAVYRRLLGLAEVHGATIDGVKLTDALQRLREISD